MRWIWIDRFTEFEPRTRAVAIKNVSLAEEHLHDHWQAYPVMPASLMIEGMAQTAGLLVGQADGFANDVVLAKVTRAEFTDIATPGDQLIYEAIVEHLGEAGGSIEGTIHRNGDVIGNIRMMFSYANESAIGRELPKGFVFTESFQRLLSPFIGDGDHA
ncbi:MAG: beta-hydroxyacyl-ACP dehydratase [Planctomycetes bacterium]|jgi:3-hydroxyacyl-[acyl-carrier-protein] dehydratase|nr:beta-hydroxyacyl-ACP dehydratase [Planctomycetota bacterium]